MNLGSMSTFALFSVLCVFGTNAALAGEGKQPNKKHQTLERINHTETICRKKADLLNEICWGEVDANVLTSMKACEQTKRRAEVFKELGDKFSWALSLCKSETDALGLKIKLKFEFIKMCSNTYRYEQKKCVIDAYEARKALKDSQKNK